MTGTVEVRTYIQTFHMFFNAEGEYVGEDPQNDLTWYDTLEARPMTEEEEADWL